MLRFNTYTIEKPSFSFTDENFLQIKGSILEAEKEMTYFNRDGPVKEVISKETLFSKEVKDSFRNKTVTFEHPKKSGKLTMVNSENVTEFKKGTIIDVREEGNRLSAILQVEEKNSIDFIMDRYNRGESVELSAGYEAESVYKNGRYFQEKIKGNHVALLNGKGRGGPDVKLIFNYYEEETMEKLKFNEKEWTGEELVQEAERLQKENTEIKGKYNSLISKNEEKEVNAVAEKYNVKAGENTFDTMVNVIKKNNPKFNHGEAKTVEEIRGIYNYAVEALSSGNEPPKASKTGEGKNDDDENNKFNSIEGRNDFFRNYGMEGK